MQSIIYYFHQLSYLLCTYPSSFYVSELEDRLPLKLPFVPHEPLPPHPIFLPTFNFELTQARKSYHCIELEKPDKDRH